MAFQAGKNSQFSIDNSADVLTDITAYTDTADLENKLAALETTVFGESAKAFIPGLSDASISIGGLWDPTLDSTLSGTQAALAAGTNPTAGWQYGPAGTTTGLPKYTGESILTDFKVSTSVSGAAKWTATLQVSGLVTRGTF